MLVLAVPALGAGALAGYQPDKEGFLRDWLLAGPYPNPQAEPEPAGFSADLLGRFGGEAAVEPYPGMTDEVSFVADKARLIARVGATNDWGFTETRNFPIVWRELHWDAPDPIISLDGRFGEIRDWLAAFAACRVISPCDRTVHLRVGSDDGYKLYLNHELVGGLTLSRAAARDQNIHVAKLREGPNLIVLKITDQTGGHAFCLRITDPKGVPYDDLQVTLSDPAREAAARCQGLPAVDVMDRQGFAAIRLGEEPRFPGKLKLQALLGLAEARSCQVELLVTDGGDRELLSRSISADLSPTRAVPITAEVDIAHAGRATVSLLVRDADDKTVLAHLTRGFEVLSPEGVQHRHADLVQAVADQAARARSLEAEVAAARRQLAAVRTAVGAQYRRIEELYAERRAAVVARHDKDGRSVDTPFTPVASPRESLCLNGDSWQVAAARSLGGYRVDELAPPADGWEPARVPSIGVERYFRGSFFPARGRGGPYGPTELLKCAPPGWHLSDVRIGDGIWYRTKLQLPERWRGRRLFFATDCASDRISVDFDGKRCGTHTGWPGRIEIELPPVVPGPHELLVLAVRARSYGDTTRLKEFFGLWGDVYVTTGSDVGVTDSVVVTRWRDCEIEARLWLINRGAKPRTVTVDSQAVRAGRSRLPVGRREVTLAPGVVNEVRFTRPWVDPDLWGIGGEHGPPNLYQLVTTVREADTVLDRQFTRFGFREVWREGFHLYLNGKRLFIQGDNVGDRLTDRPAIVLWQRLLRESCNLNAIRLHFEPQQGMFADIADELGMLILAQWYPNLHVKGARNEALTEQALSVPEFLTTEEHRENLRLYAEWVKWLRNHPSVIVYCTDNEVFTQAWDSPEKLAANVRNDRIAAVYGQYVKAIDPTRLVTRDGDEGTWGKLGKWQEDPPAELANYHYPDFNTRDLVENWEATYGKPVLFGETLYCSYGAWDGWVGPIPSQVAAKADRCRRVLSLYRDLEIPGWVGMGAGLDCFIEDKPDGSGNPWGISTAMLAQYKAQGVIDKLPRYPYFPIEWPSCSGPSYKPDFHRYITCYGYGAVNAHFRELPLCVPNAVTAAYKDSTRPQPPLGARHTTEVLVTVTRGGTPLAFAQVVLTPRAGQACGPLGVVADAGGRAWFVLPEPGAYEARVEGASGVTPIEAAPLSSALTPGFDYLPRITMEVLP